MLWTGSTSWMILEKHINNTTINHAIRAKDPNWKKDKLDKVWTWKERVYIPLILKLPELAIGHCHYYMMAGHPGVAKTLELVTRTFWWLNMKKDIEKYIKGCHICQTAKPKQQPKAAPLQPNEIPSKPWETISVDLIGLLTPSKGKDMILVIMDQFSKKAYFLPTNMTITSQGVANLYKEHVLRTRPSKEGDIRWRTAIHVGIHERALYPTRNHTKPLDSLSSTNGQSNRMRKPRTS